MYGKVTTLGLYHFIIITIIVYYLSFIIVNEFVTVKRHTLNYPYGLTLDQERQMMYIGDMSNFRILAVNVSDLSSSHAIFTTTSIADGISPLFPPFLSSSLPLSPFLTFRIRSELDRNNPAAKHGEV